jgi:hypothetical protein
MLQANCETYAAQRISNSSCAYCQEQQRAIRYLVSDSVQKAAAYASNLLQHTCTSAVLRQYASTNVKVVRVHVRAAAGGTALVC